MEERCVLGGAERIYAIPIGTVQEVALVSHFRLPLFRPANLVAHHVEEQSVVGGKNYLDGGGSTVLVLPTCCPAQELSEVAGHRDGVVVIQR